MIPHRVRIGRYEVGRDCRLLLIAGPCVIEDLGATMELAGQLREITRDRPVQWVFKASFDKANRTSNEAYRGPGLKTGLEVLQRVRDEFGVPVTTDIHEPHQAAPAGEVCELLQIPAFLARQTDLLAAAARTKRAVNVKKAQFLAPWDMRHVIEKLQAAGGQDVCVTERGTFFGYGRLVNDMRAIPQLHELQVPVIFDATHSVQEPGGLGRSTGGNRQMVEPLARAAVAIGIDGLFFETHANPAASPSDGPNMVPLDQFADLLDRLLRIRETVEAFSC